MHPDVLAFDALVDPEATPPTDVANLVQIRYGKENSKHTMTQLTPGQRSHDRPMQSSLDNVLKQFAIVYQHLHYGQAFKPTPT